MPTLRIKAHDFAGDTSENDYLILRAPRLRESTQTGAFVNPTARRIRLKAPHIDIPNIQPGALRVEVFSSGFSGSEVFTVQVPNESGVVNLGDLLRQSLPVEEPSVSKVSKFFDDVKKLAGVVASDREESARLLGQVRESAASALTAARSAAVDAAAAVRSEVSALTQRAQRSADSAGVHETKAKGHADRAANAAATAVVDAVNSLKGNAPAAFDTLAEIAERIKAGGTLETELLRKIAEKASAVDFQALKNRVDRLGISAVSGLSAALASKASANDLGSLSRRVADLEQLPLLLALDSYSVPSAAKVSMRALIIGTGEIRGIDP